MNITAIILTYNEEIHLDRCIKSLNGLVKTVVVVDCFSTDKTLEIALANGALILQHNWVSHADQFNWALNQLDTSHDWILRIDADEIISAKLGEQIRSLLNRTPTEVYGIYCARRIVFQSRLIKYGGVFPVKIMRLFRFGYGKCEDRLMDEHIVVSGATAYLNGELIDNNLNTLSWWTEKHNKYASLEAIELLNLEFRFKEKKLIPKTSYKEQPYIKRWIKENIYLLLPGGLRSFIYFFYRYVIRLGFMDGREGCAFHFLQGFWYRYLVDAKLREVKRYMKLNNVDIRVAIKRVFSIDV